MLKPVKQWLHCLFMLVSASLSHFAVAATFHVQNQNGTALANAVIESVDAKTPLNKNLPVAIMDQVNKQFAPQVLLIEQGQSVLFPNSDDIRHHVYSFSHVKPFELKLYSGKPKAPISFSAPGVAVLGCNIHDSMVGYIYIAQSSDVVMTDKDGNAQLNVTATSEIYVWHNLSIDGAESRKTLNVGKLSQKNGRYVITIETAEPEARDTFGDRFQ